MKKTRFVLFAALVAALAVAFTSCKMEIPTVPAEKQGIYVPAKVIYTEGDTVTTDVADWTNKTCTRNGEEVTLFETRLDIADAWKVEATTAHMSTSYITDSEFHELGYLAYDEWGTTEYTAEPDGNNIVLKVYMGSLFGYQVWETFYPSDDPAYDYYTFFEHEATSDSDHTYTKETYYKIF
ncbi:MAG: hypothetical protein J6Y69_03575 [Treponema sp.]|nr:hypothetical protein [Treponema sp.]